MQNVLPITIPQLIFGISTTTILLGFLQVLLVKWLSARIEKSIQYEYDTRLEDYRTSILHREQAAKIAELFSFWLTVDDDLLKGMTKKERTDHCEKLNKLTWELAIWIPNEDIVIDIMDKLSHSSKKDIKEIILSIREQIHNKKCDTLNWKKIVSFT